MKLSELKPEEHIFALFIGRSGSGKTAAATSFPKPHNLDFDGRIEGLLPMRHIIKQEVTYDSFKRPKGWLDVDQYLDGLAMDILQRSPTIPLTLIPDSIGGFTRLMLSESMDLQRGQVVKQSPKKDGGLRMPGLHDYNYESAATLQLFDALRGLKINVIVTGHIIPLWGKPEGGGEDMKGGPNEVIGEKINIRDNLGETALTYFNEVYRFEKKVVNEKTGEAKHFVKFNTDMARSSLLSNLKGEFDITGQNFYEFWQKKVKEVIK